MKIALAQQNYIVGDFEGNLGKILKGIDEAAAKGADIVVFPELAVCGYPPRDFLDYKDFTRRSLQSVDTIRKYAAGKVAVLVGSPSFNNDSDGKDLYNSAFFLHNGKIIHLANKALLPTYDIFDEYRYFEPAKNFSVAEFGGKRIAVTICEDIWDIDDVNPMYTFNPMERLMEQEPDIMINLSASPFSYRHADERIAVVKANAIIYNLPVFYCNAVGAQTDIIFDGGSLVASPSGYIVDELPYFEPALRVYDCSEVCHPENSSVRDNIAPKESLPLIHDALILGIRDYFQKSGFSKAILGLSGGIDSALTLVLAVRALGAENVLSVLMPSQYSSDHSIDDSLALVKNLGSPYHIIPIHDVYQAFETALQPYFNGLPHNVAEENLQSRIRGNYLMALSNKHGYILLNTSNKSEAAVGYGTLYGDMCGAIGIIGDVYKTQVFQLCEYINKDREIIPRNIITKPPSAELRPNQKDSDSLPDYDILDKVLYEYIEHCYGPEEIIAQGFDEALVRRVLRLVNRAEFKRYQTPPLLRISHKAFGMGRRLPIVARYLE
jgi:NAD+ synthase (glutamine-hydrolysing)